MFIQAALEPFPACPLLFLPIPSQRLIAKMKADGHSGVIVLKGGEQVRCEQYDGRLALPFPPLMAMPPALPPDRRRATTRITRTFSARNPTFTGTSRCSLLPSPLSLPPHLSHRSSYLSTNRCFGVTEADFYGAIDIDSGKAVLFPPRLPQEYSVWMGKVQRRRWT